MTDNLNWEKFSNQYHLKSDKYIQDVNLLQRLQSKDNYPVIMYPKLLSEQLSKKFVIGSIGVGKDKSHLFLHDFLDVAKQLNLPGDNWDFLIHPYRPQENEIPQMPKIPTEKTELYKTRNWGCLILYLVMWSLFISTLSAIFLSPVSPADFFIAVIVAILWIPSILFIAYELRIGKSETKVRKVKLTEDEIELLKKEALEKYQKELETRKKILTEYEDKKSEFEKRLNSQAQILDSHSKIIAATLFKKCLINYPKIQDNLNPPQKGSSEDKLFYALMKEYPSYIKIDKILGIYSPDLVLSNGCSCPIDIEIDEPYVYNTKKEIHYIGCGDEERNHYFQENNWFVLRFSENQVINHLSECVSIIKAFTDFIEWGDTTKLAEAEETITKIQEKRWTKEQSRVYAIENYRYTNCR